MNAWHTVGTVRGFGGGSLVRSGDERDPCEGFRFVTARRSNAWAKGKSRLDGPVMVSEIPEGYL